MGRGDEDCQKVKCMGCGLGCNLEDYLADRTLRCPEKKLAVWPVNNYYFRLAINELIFKHALCYLNEGVVFVDHSMANLKLLISEEWLVLLSRTGMSVVLVTDKNMLPLANFWLYHSDIIKAVLLQEAPCQLKVKANKVLSGRVCRTGKNPSVTAREVAVLKLLVKGNSTNQIAEKLCCNVKSIYQSRASLRRKMGDPCRLILV